MSQLAPTGFQDFNGIRGQEPRVELILNGERVLLAERYQVRLSILTQPAAFSLTLGTGDSLRSLILDAEPNTPFQLKIADRLVMTGRLDGYSTSGATGILQVEGRDALAPLHDAYMIQEQTFKDDTYAALTRKVMDAIGLTDTKLAFSNRANRAAIMGLDPQNYRTAGSAKPKPPRAVEGLTIGSGKGGGIKKHVQSQLGEKAYEFLKRHLDRAGLFLWAAADGSYVLSEPYTDQTPLMLIQRSQGVSPEFAQPIVDSRHENKTAGRFSQYYVYTRGETKKAGRAKATGFVPDSEMVEWGFDRSFAMRDPDADTAAKAEFMARRKMAESRRAGWKLSYTMSGHIDGSKAGKRLTWAPDSMVEVSDKRLGIYGNYWIESVTFAGNPQSTTQLDLMRVDDLVFGDAPT